MNFPYKVFHANMYGDAAGVSWLLHKTMVARKIKSNHFVPGVAHINGLSQGEDIVGWNDPRFRKAVNEADIFHVNNHFGDSMDMATRNCHIDVELTERPFVFHNHGGVWLLDPTVQLKFLSNLNKHHYYVACSPLTVKVIPEAKWLPNICPINDTSYMPVERNFDDGNIKVCHKIFSKNVGFYKGTDIYSDLTYWLGEGRFKYPLDFQVIHNLPIHACLNKTADFHICIDNTTQGFIGMSGWESLSKGQVVIARLDPVVEASYKKFGNGTCPIVNVSGMDEIAKVLREFCNDRGLLKEKCLESRKWMEHNYPEDRILALYLKTYKELIDAWTDDKKRFDDG